MSSVCPIKQEKFLHTRLKYIYQGMRKRCDPANRLKHPRYSGRGIKCLWNSYEEFEKDMLAEYLKHCQDYGSRNTSIDRINNDGDYHKDNCRWATCFQQARNRANTLSYKIDNELKTSQEMAAKLGISVNNLYVRRHREAKRLTLPPHP